MFRRISLGKTRNCSRAFSLISIRYRIADILLVHSCADKLGYAKQPSSLFKVCDSEGAVEPSRIDLHRYNVVKAPAVGVITVWKWPAAFLEGHISGPCRWLF